MNVKQILHSLETYLLILIQCESGATWEFFISINYHTWEPCVTQHRDTFPDLQQEEIVTNILLNLRNFTEKRFYITAQEDFYH